MGFLKDLLRIAKHLLKPYYRNPGGWNMDSVLTIVGVTSAPRKN